MYQNIIEKLNFDFAHFNSVSRSGYDAFNKYFISVLNLRKALFKSWFLLLLRDYSLLRIQDTTEALYIVINISEEVTNLASTDRIRIQLKMNRASSMHSLITSLNVFSGKMSMRFYIGYSI